MSGHCNSTIHKHKQICTLLTWITRLSLFLQWFEFLSLCAGWLCNLWESLVYSYFTNYLNDINMVLLWDLWSQNKSVCNLTNHSIIPGPPLLEVNSLLTLFVCYTNHFLFQIFLWLVLFTCILIPPYGTEKGDFEFWVY